MTGDQRAQLTPTALVALETLEERIALNRKIRITFVQWIGWLFFIAGPLMIFTGGVPSVEASVGNWTRIVFGLIALSAGTLMLTGLTIPESDPMRGALKTAGLVLGGGLFALMAAGATLVIFKDVGITQIFHSPTSDIPYPARPWSICMYLCLTGLLGEIASIVWTSSRGKKR